MFKSIEYRLIAYLAILMISIAAATLFFLFDDYMYGVGAIVLILFSLNRMWHHYGRFNKNILFLLNALDNGDYSFNFAVDKLSKREYELNRMMNRIKEILAKAREEAIENEQFLSLIVESVSVGIIILDSRSNVIASNRAVCNLFGIPIFTHLNQLSVIDKDFPKIFRSIEPSVNRTIKIQNEREELYVALQTSRISIKRGKMKIVTLNSIGNELEAKEMESWIRLIRVMTHEIMNSVAPITSLTDTLLFSYKKSFPEGGVRSSLEENTIEALQTIGTTAKGLVNFVNSYRSFTGISQPQRSSVDIVALINSVANLYKDSLLFKNIEIVTDSSLLCIEADGSQITQVTTNLIKNASEAIGGEERGRIVIKIYMADDRVCIDICNNGKAIPKDVLPNIFIPFFTTKDKGSGIGLSVSRYIMRLHGGNLKHSQREEWTVFSMIFAQ
jgi:PAS domain S-box